MRKKRKTRFLWAFWRHYADLWPDNPNAPKLRDEFGRSFIDYYIESADLTIRQSIGSVSIGVYLTGAPGESEETVKKRIEPFRERLERELPIRPDSDKWYAGPMETRRELEQGTRHWNNWDAMADWFECQRLKYEEILDS